MKFLFMILWLLPAAALAQVPASGVTLDDYLWQKRPVVVFADSAEDPAFRTQMDYLARDAQSLEDRDVVIITDTDPAARSAVREKLRPRGFSLVILEKDGKVALRKPMPWHVREIVRAIDKFPLRRQEIEDAGRY
ncbi:DUF4174 domain-containing protein [Falsirhodobacter xinxiangensis]|uniref:DUF4174 domain-containing protein n=1 Tax=Falsirhodobacter xinxiangensis TaxID=2530049 RepID=UPI0010AB4B60|nr:DUF4174 domain-containing protein [Rhodobacter xinxiangensis]